ncbi:MAG: PP2C family protein-serine/threonine phosphatase, partial [Actinomycetota bacterium]
GDFYDFIGLPDGRLAIVTGDVTGKGVPAALVMATTRSLLRGEAPRLLSPSAILQRANELLIDDVPEHMFVTCLCAVLDPRTGKMTIANAGHNLPFVRNDRATRELRATGMPLGLMPGMTYQEYETTLRAGDGLLLHSDGVVEAHNPQGDMFGFPRMRSLVAECDHSTTIIDRLLDELDSFTGANWEQEDDITLVLLSRTVEPPRPVDPGPAAPLTAEETV